AEGAARSARTAIAGLERATRARQAEIMPVDARGDRLYLQGRIRHANAESRNSDPLHRNLPQWQMLARQANDGLVGGFLDAEALNRVDSDPVALGGREDALGKQIFAASVARNCLDVHADRIAFVGARERC